MNLLNSPVFLLLFFIGLIIIIIITGIIFFKIISSQLIKQNQQSFLELANNNFDKREQVIDHLVKPLKESLDKFEAKVQDIEKSRIGAYAGLTQQVKSLLETQLQLRNETANLTNALRKPQVRGRWGEIQLQRVVELAGMLENCDFFQQENTVNINHAQLRPDLIIKLPGGKQIVVDAKTPLASFLESLENQSELQQQQKIKDHARHVREHIKKLSQKNYWDQFNPSPEFVILFLPGESFFSAALEADPALIEHGVEKQVIIATPTTLIALLKSIAYGWRQENLAKNAARISELGKELGNRLKDFSCHFQTVGDKLEKTLESYNKMIGTYESRVLVSARKFQALNGAAENTLEIMGPLTLSARKLHTKNLPETQEENHD